MSYGNGEEPMSVVASKPCKSHLENQLQREVATRMVDQQMLDAINAFTIKNGSHTIRDMGLYRVYGEVSLNMNQTDKRIERLSKDIENAEE